MLFLDCNVLVVGRCVLFVGCRSFYFFIFLFGCRCVLCVVRCVLHDACWLSFDTRGCSCVGRCMLRVVCCLTIVACCLLLVGC